MNIAFSQPGEHADLQDKTHILTVAESGFSMLSGYASEHFGIDASIICQFEEQVNHSNQIGSLYPQAPISAVPCKYFRELSESTDPDVLNEFKQHITEFLNANSNALKSRNLLIDFHVSPSAVPQQYIDATLDVLRHHSNNILKNVTIISQRNK